MWTGAAGLGLDVGMGTIGILQACWEPVRPCNVMSVHDKHKCQAAYLQVQPLSQQDPSQQASLLLLSG